jgi:hypothetical protein
MRNRRFVLAVIFFAGVVTGVGASGWAQVMRTASPVTTEERFTIRTDTAGNIVKSSKASPTMVLNDTLALKVAGKRQGRLVGTLVAKVGNEWVEVQFAPQDSIAR